MTSLAPYGYLLVHFIEDRHQHKEKIYFTLSDGDTPLRWRLANRGEPVLESTVGTTGVRDPHVVRGPDGWFLIATDLRVWAYGPDHEPDWDQLSRHGSRSLVVWQSPDLVHWSTPWLAEVAPPTAGMAWAPEATYEAATGEFAVYWSSTLFDAGDRDHEGDSSSRILLARTRDFRTFTAAEVLIDRGVPVIDTTIAQAPDGRWHRFSKAETPHGASNLFHEVGTGIDADDYQTLATGIASDLYAGVEGPLVFTDHTDGRWYLWVDQYSVAPQGYVPLTTDDVGSGKWKPVPDDQLQLAPCTKHGVVVSLPAGMWEQLMRAYPPQ